MAEKDFAIVCDAGCDLPGSFLEPQGVVLVDAGAGPLADALAAAISTLAEKGATHVVAVHSSASLGPEGGATHAAAERVRAAYPDLHVELVDTGVATVGTGMVVERLAFMRAAGAGFDDAVAAARRFANRVRTLVVVAPGAFVVSRRGPRGKKEGLLGRATSLLRLKVVGERGLYLIKEGETTQLARATGLVELTSRLAHAMSSVAAVEGPLVYAKVETGDARALRALEKPLDTNEFEARCLGTVRAGHVTTAAVGTGAVAVALVPARAYDDPLGSA